MLRHPVSLERLSLTADGQVAYKLKYPRGPKRTHLLLEPVRLLARLASLIPPPRHPLVRTFGVLNSASRWRAHVVPRSPARRRAACEPSTQVKQHPSSIDAEAGRRLLEAGPALWESDEGASNHQPWFAGCVAAAAPSWIPWAELLRRVFSVDALRCVRCGGRLEMIGVVTNPPVVEAILEHLGLPSNPPTMAHARDPTYDEPLVLAP